jgi:sodium pump decarboxylase gamma subunit
MGVGSGREREDGDGIVIAQGIVLMVIGMLVVFSFLALLVFAMSMSAVFFKRFAHWFPEPVTPVSKATKRMGDGDAQTDIAVAIAAVRAFISK